VAGAQNSLSSGGWKKSLGRHLVGGKEKQSKEEEHNIEASSFVLWLFTETCNTALTTVMVRKVVERGGNLMSERNKMTRTARGKKRGRWPRQRFQKIEGWRVRAQ